MKKETILYRTIEELVKDKHENYIIVCDENIKKKYIAIAQSKGLLKKVQFKTFVNLISDLRGDYTKLAIYDLYTTLNITPNNAKIILNASSLIKEHINEKFSYLLNVKKQCEKYLEKDELSLIEYQKNKILIIQEAVLDISDDNLFMAMKLMEENKISFNIGLITRNNSYVPKLYEFKKAKDEVFYVYNEIAKLLDNGIEPCSIIIHCSNNEYSNIIKEASYLFGIDTIIDTVNTLFAYPISKKIIDIMDNNEEFELQYLPELYIKNNLQDEEHSDKMVQIINEYITSFSTINVKIKDVKELIVDQIKQTNVMKNKYKNAIFVTDVYQNISDENSYVFILGANQGSFPKIKKDDYYLFDDEKTLIGLPTSTKMNDVVKAKWLYIIKNIRNLVISYSLSLPSSEQYRSSILDEISAETIDGDNELLKCSTIYSEAFAQLELAKKQEKFFKFDEIDLKLKQYKMSLDNYDNRKYSYSNTLKNVDYKPKKLLLSYTSIDEYFQCPFRYYLNRVLNIKKEFNPEYLKLGNLFHYVLKDVLESNNTVDKSINSFYIENNIELTAKDMVMNQVYANFLTNAIDEIINFNKNSFFKVLGLEKEYQVYLGEIEGTEVYLVGKIDKIMTGVVDDEMYALVVDYKTKDSSFSFDDVVYGLDMQIPIYYYLINNSSSDKYKYGGGFLQSLVPSTQFGYEVDKSYSGHLKDLYRLNGYSSNNKRVLYSMNNTFEESNCFEGIALKKDNDFKTHSLKRVLSDEQFEQLMNLTSSNIDKAVNGILRGEFPINPLYTNSARGCDYCPYQEICFFDKKRYNYQTHQAIHDYLKGVK